METQKKEKPGKEDIVRIFMQYSGQFVNLKNAGKSPSAKMKTIHLLDGSICFDHEPPNRWNVQDFCIEVKSLGRILDQDAEELGKLWVPEIIQGSKGMARYTSTHSIDLGRAIANQFKYDNRAEGQTFNQLLLFSDFLREKGYAMPYKGWSVEQLVEFGIYKLID